MEQNVKFKIFQYTIFGANLHKVLTPDDFIVTLKFKKETKSDNTNILNYEKIEIVKCIFQQSSILLVALVNEDSKINSTEMHSLVKMFIYETIFPSKVDSSELEEFKRLFDSYNNNTDFNELPLTYCLAKNLFGI